MKHFMLYEHIKYGRNNVKCHFKESYFETNFEELFKSQDKDQRTLGHQPQTGDCIQN